MKSFFVAVFFLACNSSAQAKLITAVWDSPLLNSTAGFSGSFTGFDANNDDYLTYGELLTFDLVFTGDTSRPSFAHDLGNLFPDDNVTQNNFLFALTQHCDPTGVICDYPFGATGSIPDILSMATADSFILGSSGAYVGSGNFSQWLYGNDAWNLPGGSSFHGVGSMRITVPAPASGLLVALGVGLILRRRVGIAGVSAPALSDT